MNNKTNSINPNNIAKILSEYNSILDKITNNKVIISIAKNPYWQVNGITIKDPDGHCVVITNLKIEKPNA